MKFKVLIFKEIIDKVSPDINFQFQGNLGNSLRYINQSQHALTLYFDKLPNEFLNEMQLSELLCLPGLKRVKLEVKGKPGEAIEVKAN